MINLADISIQTRRNLLFSFVIPALAFSVIFLNSCQVEKSKVELVKIAPEEESCIKCHGNMTGFVAGHLPEKIGCVACHEGHPEFENADRSHEDMVKIPGNLSNASTSCSSVECHPGIDQRVNNSLMTTMSGVISVDKYFFGETSSLQDKFHIQNLGHSPADKHLRNLCASCHLGNEKTEYEAVHENSRGGGCLACHLNYSAEAKKELNLFKEHPDESTLPKYHPTLSLEVKNEHCFGCHSRSGRISTSYEGWHETQFSEKEIAGKEGFRVLEDHRVFQMIKPDIHHTIGLDCIDCHSSMEIMGDGISYAHEEEAVKIRCADCHFNQKPKTEKYDNLDPESKKIMALRGWKNDSLQYIVGQESKEPLYNLFLKNDSSFLKQKNSGRLHLLSSPADICTKNEAHSSLTCSACHTEWAPQCIGCHNQYDPKIKSYDLLAKKKTQGKWVELLGDFYAEPPTLGIVEIKKADEATLKRVKAFIPGMIMTTDRSLIEGDTLDDFYFHRLFAPLETHTTNKSGRSCISCHLNPLAIGYGRGTLNYDEYGKFTFDADYALSPHDQKPEDSWIGFLEEIELEEINSVSTRDNARPFNLEEQRRILTVGACLTCHKENSKVMKRGLKDFEKELKRRSNHCVIPVW